MSDKIARLYGVSYGNPTSPLGFLRKDKVRIHVRKSAIEERE